MRTEKGGYKSEEASLSLQFRTNESTLHGTARKNNHIDNHKFATLLQGNVQTY